MYQKFECFMPPFQENRTIHVYMPDTNKRYPVLYMFDGHNLFFDQDATYGRSWRWGDNLERYIENVLLWVKNVHIITMIV